MKRKKLYLALFALAVPFFLSLACGTSGPPAIGEVVPATSLDDGYKPVNATTSYQPEDTIFISVEVLDLEVGNAVQVQYKLNGDIYEETTLTADETGSGYYGFSLKPNEFGHTPGIYTAEVFLNGTLVKTVTFTVEGDATPMLVDVVIAESLDDDASPVNPTTTFGTMDIVSISIQVANIRAGSEIRIVYTYEGQTMEQTTTATESGSGYFGFTFSPNESGHATGEYTVEVFLDNEPYMEPLSFIIQ